MPRLCSYSAPEKRNSPFILFHLDRLVAAQSPSVRTGRINLGCSPETSHSLIVILMQRETVACCYPSLRRFPVNRHERL
jgi:hypothetical protein